MSQYRPKVHRLSVEYPKAELHTLTLYCANGLGVTPTAIMRALLTEFLAQVNDKLHQGATIQDVSAAVPIAVENVRARLERTNG